jgi:adenylosuccinate synthase
MCDLFDEEVFEQKLTRLAMGFQKRFGDLLQYDVKAEIEKYKVGSDSSPMRAHHGG